MKKEILKTLLWILISIIWTGAHKLVIYLIEMQYSSKVAPTQVDDDSAYTVMKTHGSVINVVDYAYYTGFLVIIFFILMTWAKRNKPAI